jgi:hypothetical protein
MACYSEVYLCGVLLIIAVSLQGCGVSDCSQKCDEYDHRGHSFDPLGPDTETVCLSTTEQTGGLSVCQDPIVTPKGTFHTGICNGCCENGDLCKQLGGKAAVYGETVSLSGGVPRAVATPAANLCVAFLAGALILMVAMRVILFLRQRQQSSTDDNLMQESDVEELGE